MKSRRHSRHRAATRRLGPVLALLLLTAPALAASGEDACVVASAERLPRVAGLAIKGSTVRTLTAEQAAGWRQNPSPPVLVDLKVDAAGREMTYTYLCGATREGLFVRPLPDGKLPR